MLDVLRRHQRKLLAVFAILAMISFVLSDSLTKLLAPSPTSRDQVVATLFGKSVYRSDLLSMQSQRVIANMFVSELGPFLGRNPFGGVRDRDLIDALILEHEADRLGIPATREMGIDWLKQITSNRMTSELFESLLARMNNQVSGSQLLLDIANQVPLANTRRFLGPPLVTPLEVFQAYRDQNERVGAKLVEIPVDKFLSQTPEPTDAEIKAEYDRHMNELPDPSRVTPGFKIPRQIQLEILSVDGNALARGLKDKLTESELKTAYENRKSEFKVRSELPDDLFAGQPELTPPVLQSFAAVRSVLATGLAEDRAQAEIVDRFAKVKDEILIPFADRYANTLDEIDLAKKEGRSSKKVALPEPDSLKDLATREGFGYELTPLISREDVAKLGPVADAEVGLKRLGGGRGLVEEFFDSKKGLYEPAELTDILGTRFLVRKMKDEPPRVPSLEEIRPQVVLAWKMERARTLAEKAAIALTDQVKKAGGIIKDATLSGYRVITIAPIARMRTSFLPGQFDAGTPIETPIADVAYPDHAFRDAYFGLQPKEPAVAPNEPKTVYYVMSLDRREPATFTALYAPNGDEYRFKSMSKDSAARRLDEQWMGWLRKEAGLADDWTPPDEAKSKADSRGA